MKSTKYLGIWMDHSIAHVMGFENDTIVTNTVESHLIPPPDGQSLYPDKESVSDTSQEQRSEYYQKLSDLILDYESVVLFGPTESKNELFNLLIYNHLFDKINLAIKHAVQMDEIERTKFIRANFYSSGTEPKIFQNRMFSFI